MVLLLKVISSDLSILHLSVCWEHSLPPQHPRVLVLGCILLLLVQTPLEPSRLLESLLRKDQLSAGKLKRTAKVWVAAFPLAVCWCRRDICVFASLLSCRPF